MSAAISDRRIAIIGLGLMGGSLARDLAAAGFQIGGYDSDLATLDEAVNEDVVTERFDADLGRIQDYPVIVIGTPVRSAVDLLRQLAPLSATARLITDLGSVKGPIVRAAESLGISSRFVGSHPLAGDHRSGWSASRKGLFQDVRVFLCRAMNSSEDVFHLSTELWETAGARTETIDAEAHDELMASASHLPQILSSVLAHLLRDKGIKRDSLGPGGRDMTRLAGSDPKMWTELSAANADHLNANLDQFATQLNGVRLALSRNDEEALRLFFEESREWFGKE